LLNVALANHGLATVNLMQNPTLFKPMMVAQYMWKNVGWGTIIFLAAITKVEPHLYEAAVVDGATAWRRMWHVTLPGIRGIAVLLLILNLGNILTTGFEQILLQEPAVGASAGQVLDTFVYFEGILGGNWGLSAAVGLFKGVIGTILIISANKVAHVLGEQGVF
jgi:putative aldouronate transport system permease protein